MITSCSLAAREASERSAASRLTKRSWLCNSEPKKACHSACW